MITIRTERPADASAREALLEAAYGPSRHAKPSARLRRRRLPALGLSFVALERGRVVGTVRLWNVEAGHAHPALLLGPLAVHPAAQKRGIGAALMRHAVAEAARLGHGALLLVGDAAYYGRFGFASGKTSGLALPGADPARLLALELQPGALDGAHGRIAATGLRQPAVAPARPSGKTTPRFVPQAA